MRPEAGAMCVERRGPGTYSCGMLQTLVLNHYQLRCCFLR